MADVQLQQRLGNQELLQRTAAGADAGEETDVRVASFCELSATLDGEGGTERYLALAEHDHRFSEGSVLIDAGSDDSARTVDRLGAPICGAPDLGPHEFQPQSTMASTPLIVQSQIRPHLLDLSIGSWDEQARTWSVDLRDLRLQPRTSRPGSAPAARLSAPAGLAPAPRACRPALRQRFTKRRMAASAKDAATDESLSIGEAQSLLCLWAHSRHEASP